MRVFRHPDCPPLKRLGALLALCLALVLSAPVAAREWQRADTPNFIIYSDGYPHELQRWAKKIEMYNAVLREHFGRPPDRKGARLTIYMLENERAVARLVGQKYLAGLYNPSSEGSYAITNRKPTYYKKDMSGQQTLFHEYAHHFMYRHFPAAYPAWYREGFAEYVATVTFDVDGYWTFGLPATHRQKHLDKDPLPIETVLFGDADSLEPKRHSAFYAWSWLLVHMLNSDAGRAGQLQAYLAKFSAGESPQKAAQVFGDLGTLEAQLRAYAQSAHRHRQSKKPIAWSDEIHVTALDPLASRLIELGLERRTKRDLEATRNSLRQLAKTAPNDADVQLELALTERDIARRSRPRDFSRAEAAADRALTADPSHTRANVLKASLAISRLRQSRSVSRQDWIKARLRLIFAIRETPGDPLPYLRLFSSYSRQGRRPSKSAHQAIAKAFTLQPESTDIRIAYAFSLAMQGKHGNAMRLARVLASDPHAAHLGKRAMATLERMKAASPNKTGVPHRASLQEQPADD